jgi:hypothetical protein
MSWVKKVFPFNAEQTVNIASEFGPLIAMFVVNGITGKVEDGTWALLIGTVAAMAAMQMVLKRLPIFPLIASGVTVVFGIMTLVKELLPVHFREDIPLHARGLGQADLELRDLLHHTGRCQRVCAHHLSPGRQLQHPRNDDGRRECVDHVQDRHHHAGHRHLCLGHDAPVAAPSPA